jgi:hypothetical protein
LIGFQKTPATSRGVAPRIHTRDYENNKPMTNSSLDNAYYKYEISVDWLGLTAAIVVAISAGFLAWWLVKQRRK